MLDISPSRYFAGSAGRAITEPGIIQQDGKSGAGQMKGKPDA